MVDIHSHIIPAIDDGAQNIEESLEIIRAEVMAGTTAFVATPHIYNDQELDAAEQIPIRLDELRQVVEEHQIEVRLFAGAEVYPSMGILKALDAGRPITVGGHRKHMLVDLPMGALPMDFDQILFEIQTRGVTPILAHPERNAVFQNDPKKLFEYVERGIALQVNSGSLRGKYGQDAVGVGNYILRRHWAHFIASDSHRAKAEGNLRSGVNRMIDKLSPAYLDLLTCRSGEAVVRGEHLPPLPAEPDREKESKGFLKKLFSR